MIASIHDTKATFLQMSEEKVKYWSCTNYYACVIFTQPVKTVLSNNRNRNNTIKVVLSIAKKNEDNASSFRSLSPLGLF